MYVCLSVCPWLQELDPVFPAEFGFWHLGGDEVQYGCWENSDNGYMAKFMKANGIAADDYPGLQSYFEQKVGTARKGTVFPRGSTRVIVVSKTVPFLAVCLSVLEGD
eukprot:SAG22_NODE_1315_length_4769_cov_23.910064_6_plen_107_part_00